MSKLEQNNLLCANCSAKLQGAYCHNCGQKRMINRLSLKSVFSAIFKKIFDIESGLLFTIKEMFLRPGKVVQDYIQGGQMKYAKPVQFFFLTTALVFLAFGFSELYQENVNAFKEGFQLGYSGDDKSIPPYLQQLINRMVLWIKDVRTFIISSIPVYALVFKWMFRKAKLNYAEHFVFMLYITAMSNLVSLPFFLLGAYVKTIMVTVGTIASLVYAVWAINRFYKASVFKGILAYLLATLLYFVFFFIGLFSIILISVAMH